MTTLDDEGEAMQAVGGEFQHRLIHMLLVLYCPTHQAKQVVGVSDFAWVLDMHYESASRMTIRAF